MTNEEAIEFLECGAVPSCTCASNKRNGGTCPGEDAVLEAIKVAIKALEKQIPKKANPNLWDGWTECPMCGGIVQTGDYRCDFCPDCGQAIDWSDDDGE